jgi:flagellar biosynthesis protein FliP
MKGRWGRVPGLRLGRAVLTVSALLIVEVGWVTARGSPVQGISGAAAGPGGADDVKGRIDPHQRSEDERPAEVETRVEFLPLAQGMNRDNAGKTLQALALIALISLAPVGMLMMTAFVRINIVLIVLRQALGTSQVPSNQVLNALALMLTVMVMYPKGEEVYHKAVLPYTSGGTSARDAWAAGSKLIKSFMIDQIVSTRHEEYLQTLLSHAVPSSSGHFDWALSRIEESPLRVVASAYLLSELTTALKMGFYLYLPFLVIDLVVSSVLAATGLFMLPPALVATPLKLIVFVLADGWLLVAKMLLESFTLFHSGP